MSLEAKQAQNIRIFDVRGISSITDYTVIATGTAAPHLKALLGETQRHMKELGISHFRLSGEPDSGWMIADYVHVVVHVFSSEARTYYAIEKMWAKAKEIQLH